jgi:hypothetical protein
VQTENEKAVRTLFEEWLAETQYAQDSESFHNELYSAWKSGRQSAERSQAALQSQSNTDGWVMVPVEPTEEMIMAGYEGQGEATYPAVRDAYRAMLSAAPTPPQQVSNTPQDGKLREFAVMFLAFIGRDRGTERLDASLEGLTKLAQEALSAPPQQQEQSGEAVKHCNKCGLGKREWAACDAPDCGELVASNSHAKPAAYYAGDLNGQLKDFRVALVDPELEIPLNTPFFLSPQFDASTATPTATASQESAPGQEVVVETVARVFRDPELGVRVEWLIEGGAGACLDQVLLASPTKLTNDEGYGTVYLATPTSTAIAAMVIRQAAEICRVQAEYYTKQRQNGGSDYVMGLEEGFRHSYQEILALTPANAEAELEALMMRVAELRDQESAKGYMDAAYQVSDAAIVRRVLDEKGE